MINPNKISMLDLAKFMVDFDLADMDEVVSNYDIYQSMYTFTGTDADKPLQGATVYGYNLQIIRACVKKLQRLPKSSKTGNSWDTLLNVLIPDVKFSRACGIPGMGFVSTPPINTAEIDTTAKQLGMSRSELIKKILRKCKQTKKSYNMADRTISPKCAMYAHDTLKRVVMELTRLGFEAEYLIFLPDFNEQEPSGTFGVSVGSNDYRLSKLLKRGEFPVMPSPSVPWCFGDKTNGEHDIYFERPEGDDEQPVLDALRAMADWADALRGIERI